jgi:hypothetical protein
LVQAAVKPQVPSGRQVQTLLAEQVVAPGAQTPPPKVPQVAAQFCVKQRTAQLPVESQNW